LIASPLLIRQQQRARQTARAKALKEAILINQAHKIAHQKAKSEERALQQQLHKQAKQKQIAAQIDNLNIGSRVEFHEESGKHYPCKLVAIIPSTQQYIFVDRSGIKRHSPTKQQLIDKLIAPTAKIIDQGSNFDDALEKVVTNLRERKGLSHDKS